MTPNDDRPAVLPATRSLADRLLGQRGQDGRQTWRAGTLTYGSTALLVLFCWLLVGDFAYYMRDRSGAPTLTLVLKQFDASDLVVGLLMGFIPQALSLGLVPWVSYKSDRHRGRWGRRIPYLLVPTPFVFVAMLGMGWGPEIGRWLHTVTGGSGLSDTACVILVFGVFWSMFEIGSAICNAVFFGLFNDVVPREVMGRFFALFRIVTLVDGVVFNYFVLGHAEEHYRLVFTYVGVVYFVGFLLMCLKVKEGEYPPPETFPDSRAGAWQSIRRYFTECFTQPIYLWFFAFNACWVWGTQPLALFSLYFAKSLQMDMATWGKLAALQMVLSLTVSFPVGWLVDRFHTLRVSIVVTLLYALVALWGFFFARNAATYGILLVVGGVFAGMIMTASSALGPILLPRAKFAQFNSAALMIRSIGILPIGPLCGIVFDTWGHQYHYIYLAASAGAFMSLISLVALYKHFQRHGGFQGYVAP